MKISDMNSITDTLNRIDNMLGVNGKTGGSNQKKTTQAGTPPAEEDRFELNSPHFDYTKSRPSYDVNALAIERLMRETGEIESSVSELVKGLLERQGVTKEMLLNGSVEEVTVDEAAQRKAAEMIGPDGPLGAEKVSERIVQFAIAVVGGDKGKIDLIRSSIERGFKEAEDMMGGLSDVSKETYTLIQDKLDKWIAEGNEDPNAIKNAGENA